MYLRLALSWRHPCTRLLSAGITHVHHHGSTESLNVLFRLHFLKNDCLCVGGEAASVGKHVAWHMRGCQGTTLGS